jgi:hypothetical protein
MRDARWLRSEPIVTAAHKKAPVDDLRGLLAGLAIPGAIASVRYPSGCRIRRVRVVPHDEAVIESSGPVIVSRRALDDARRVNR